MSLTNIDTPCIGICSTVYGDTVCRGCKRYYHEVIDWNTYSDQQKQAIFNRLENDIIKIITGKLTINNANLLQQQLQKFNIRYRENQHPFCLAYYLLRDAHQNIQDIKKYGIAINLQYEKLTLSQFYMQLEAELLTYAQKALV